jgi:hypothetical protein
MGVIDSTYRTAKTAAAAAGRTLRRAAVGVTVTASPDARRSVVDEMEAASFAETCHRRSQSGMDVVRVYARAPNNR